MEDRRRFLKKVFIATAGTGVVAQTTRGNIFGSMQEPNNKPFKLKYAPDLICLKIVQDLIL
jgi:hypothetical protein